MKRNLLILIVLISLAFSAYGQENLKITLGVMVPNVQTTVQMDGKSVRSSVAGPTGAPQFAGIYPWFASPNNRYVFTLEPNGDLVLYRVKGALKKLAPGVTIKVSHLWSSNTGNYPGAYLVIQTDGNLVLYWHPPYWPTQSIWSYPYWTRGIVGANLHLMNNGALVLFNGTEPVWEIAGPF